MKSRCLTKDNVHEKINHRAQFLCRYFPNTLLARVPQSLYDNIDYDGEPGIEFGPRRTVELVFYLIILMVSVLGEGNFLG